MILFSRDHKIDRKPTLLYLCVAYRSGDGGFRSFFYGDRFSACICQFKLQASLAKRSHFRLNARTLVNSNDSTVLATYFIINFYPRCVSVYTHARGAKWSFHVC